MNHEPLPQLEEPDATFSFDEFHHAKIYEAFGILCVRERGSSTTMIEFLEPTSIL